MLLSDWCWNFLDNHQHQAFWLPEHKRVIFKILLFTFRAYRALGPKYLISRFTHYTTKWSLRSSHANLLKSPTFRLKTRGAKSFAVLGPKAWNQLPSHLWLIESEPIFRKQLKTWLFAAADLQCYPLILWFSSFFRSLLCGSHSFCHPVPECSSGSGSVF